MSSYSLNTTLNSCVSEQAYLPFISPVSVWVCSDGSNGLFKSLASRVSWLTLSEGFFFNSFFERLLKALSSSSLIVLIRGVHYRLHCLFNRIAYHCVGVLFSLQHPFHQRLAPAFPVHQIGGKISYLMQRLLRKQPEHLINIGYLYGLHNKMINNKPVYVNIIETV